MVLIPQPEPESCSDNQKSSDDGAPVFHLARFHQHLQKASAVLDRQMLRGAPPHVKAVFRQIQAGLLLASQSVRHVSQRSARHG